MMSRIQTAEQVSREPADFVPFLALQHLLCREWRTVQSGSRTGSSRLVRRQDHGQGCGRSWELPMRPQMKCFFIQVGRFFGKQTVYFLGRNFFCAGTPADAVVLHPLSMRSPSRKKGNFAKYKSPKYFDSEQSGHYMDNCAFRDGSLC